jgi:hypothetical protein
LKLTVLFPYGKQHLKFNILDFARDVACIYTSVPEGFGKVPFLAKLSEYTDEQVDNIAQGKTLSVRIYSCPVGKVRVHHRSLLNF